MKLLEEIESSGDEAPSQRAALLEHLETRIEQSRESGSIPADGVRDESPQQFPEPEFDISEGKQAPGRAAVDERTSHGVVKDGPSEIRAAMPPLPTGPSKKRRFAYKAVRSDGRRVRGVLEARTQQDAASLLKKSNLQIIEIVSREAPRFRILESLSRRRRVKFETVVVFLRELAFMLGAGIGPARSLEILAEHAPERDFRITLKRCLRSVDEGKRLSAAFSDSPLVFNEAFVNMVLAGEEGGDLPRGSPQCMRRISS
jgi:hypothetical protein